MSEFADYDMTHGATEEVESGICRQSVCLSDFTFI